MEFTRPRGTRDFLFDEMRQRKKAESTLRNIFENYGYQEIKTPLFEELKLFTTKSGEEIVNQLYNFKDKSDKDSDSSGNSVANLSEQKHRRGKLKSLHCAAMQ